MFENQCQQCTYCWSRHDVIFKMTIKKIISNKVQIHNNNNIPTTLMYIAYQVLFYPKGMQTFECDQPLKKEGLIDILWSVFICWKLI